MLLVLLLRRRPRRLRAARRRQWTKRWLEKRQTQGACDHLLRELEHLVVFIRTGLVHKHNLYVFLIV